MLGVGRLHAAPAEQGPSTRGGQKEKDGNGGGERGETQTGLDASAFAAPANWPTSSELTLRRPHRLGAERWL
jgi:hypothetical protein